MTRHRERLFLSQKWSIIKEKKSEMLEFLASLQENQTRQKIYRIFLTIQKIMNAAREKLLLKKKEIAKYLRLMTASNRIKTKLRTLLRRRGSTEK